MAIKDYKDIYNNSGWAAERVLYANQLDLYSGREWTRTLHGLRDPDTGEPVMLWPLQINPMAKICRIHRAIMLGMQPDIVGMMPARTIVSRNGLDDEARDRADVIQHFISDTWYHSFGAVNFSRAALLEQYYGGVGWKISWEPWNKLLPNRMAVRLIEPAWMHVTRHAPFDFWDIEEAYIGYPITAEQARSYGVVIDDNEIIYLERWTKNEYDITINGQTITMPGDGEKAITMGGENPFEVMPLVYMPHERDAGFLGRSAIDGDSPILGLARELNSRMADKGERVQDAQGFNVLTNAREGSLTVRTIDRDGAQWLSVVDIGRRPNIGNAGDPSLTHVQPDPLPESMSRYTDELWAEIRRQSDVASAAMGDDDVSGGRITGPVTAYRMWPSTMHTMAERENATAALISIARTMLVMAAAMKGDYTQLGIKPQIDETMATTEFLVSWEPMIPIEKEQKIAILNGQLDKGGISLKTYLESLGVQDIDAEIEAIYADLQRKTEIETEGKVAIAEAQGQAFQERMNSNGGQSNNAPQRAGTS